MFSHKKNRLTEAVLPFFIYLGQLHVAKEDESTDIKLVANGAKRQIALKASHLHFVYHWYISL